MNVSALNLFIAIPISLKKENIKSFDSFVKDGSDAPNHNGKYTGSRRASPG
jgi:hypothetical protein